MARKVNIGQAPGTVSVTISTLPAKRKGSNNSRMTQVVAIDLSKKVPKALRRQDARLAKLKVQAGKQELERYMEETRQFVASMAAEYYAGMVRQTAVSLANPSVRADYYDKEKGGSEKPTSWKAQMSYFIPLLIGRTIETIPRSSLSQEGLATVGDSGGEKSVTYSDSPRMSPLATRVVVASDGTKTKEIINPLEATVSGNKIPLTGIRAYSPDLYHHERVDHNHLERKTYSQARPGFPAVEMSTKDGKRFSNDESYRRERQATEAFNLAEDSPSVNPAKLDRLRAARLAATQEYATIRNQPWRGATGQVTVNLSGSWRKLGKNYYHASEQWSEQIDERMQFVRKRFPGVVFDHTVVRTRAEKEANRVVNRGVSTHYWQKTGLLSKLMSQYARNNYEKLRLPDRYTWFGNKSGVIEFAPNAKVVRGNQVSITFPKLGNPALNLVLRQSFVTGRAATQEQIAGIIDTGLLRQPDFGGKLNKLDRLAYAEYLRPLYGRFAATAGKQFKQDVANVLRLGQTSNPRFRQTK